MTQDALSIWGSGQLFAFSGLDGHTDFRGGLVAQSVEDGLVFRQPGLAKLVVSQVQRAEFGVDWANLTTNGGPVRLVFLNAHQILIQGAAQLETLDDEYSHLQLRPVDGGLLLSAIGFPTPGALPDIDGAQAARRAWALSHADKLTGPHADLARKALQQMKGMVYAPEGQFAHRTATPDRYPHREIWLWDSVFHAVGYRHLDGQLARDLLSAVFAAQLETGQIPISFGPYATRTHRTQPPILAWGVAQVMDRAPDAAWLAGALPPLRRYLAWAETHRRLDGLFGWVEDNGALGSVCDESGMDNSPRFSGGAALQAVDLCCYMAQEYQAMAQLDPEGGWAVKAEVLKSRILAELWDPTRGLFCDRDPATGGSTGIEAVTGFLPLILGDLPQGVTEALAQAATDPTRFGTALPLPSIARSQPGYAKDMWQGPVWINMNWMIARGFARCGQDQLAADLRRRTLDAMQADYRATGSIFEYYDDAAQVTPPHLLRKGKCDPVIDPKHPSIHLVIHDYGWSATLALDWILRDAV